MKKITFVALLFIGILSFAQEQLKITYQGQYSLDETNSNTRFPGVFVASDFELIIADGLAEFKYIEKLLPQVEGSRPLVPLTLDHYYFDLNTNTYFVEQESFGRKHLVSDDLPKAEWKITKEEKEIAGITVRKATLKTEDGDELTAWYAPKLNYKIGPGIYGGLPGLILQLDSYTETQEKAILGEHFVATKVDVLKNNSKIKLPKGKSISMEEFDRLSDEQFDKIIEMNSQGVEKD